MAKQDQQQSTAPEPQKRECKHYLRLALRPGKDNGFVLWARCRYCQREWFVGSQADVLAGLAKLEQAS